LLNVNDVDLLHIPPEIKIQGQIYAMGLTLSISFGT
jgi:hypothetical protein